MVVIFVRSLEINELKSQQSWGFPGTGEKTILETESLPGFHGFRT
jgi:hypothetical protein